MQKPRIVICRHAQSVEDVDNSVYDRCDDLRVPLTKEGRRQARKVSKELSKLLATGSGLRMYTSPGVRNIQTLNIALPLLPAYLNVLVEIEPLIVKQNWGNITSANRPTIEAERYKIGVLRYTFPTGESPVHLIERLTRFKEKIFRIQGETGCDILVLSHGFEFRVLLMIIFGWAEEEFESYENLRNCEYRVLTLQGDETYTLNEPLRKHGLPITRLQQ